MTSRRADGANDGRSQSWAPQGPTAWLGRAADSALARLGEVAGAGEHLLADTRRTCSFLRGRLGFRPREDDIYVVSYPRSGTTWMQLLLHRLVGRDNLDFAHISQVSPWFERSLAIGSMSAADFEPFPSPRILKSHLPYGWLPRPGRYVYVWRDGRDVAVSYYHFYCSHLGCRDDFATFFQRFLRGDLQYRSWFDHVAGWTAHASAPEVLVVRYEDLHRDPTAVLRRVATHVGLAASEDRLAQIVAETSFEAMKGQEAKFDHATALSLERGGSARGFLRRGLTGEGAAVLEVHQTAAFEEQLRASPVRPSRQLRLSAFLH
jgi:hypothetical protein